MYIDKVDDIVTEYNSTYHNTIKMMPIDAKASSCIDFNIKILKLKLLIM